MRHAFETDQSQTPMCGAGLPAGRRWSDFLEATSLSSIDCPKCQKQASWLLHQASTARVRVRQDELVPVHRVFAEMGAELTDSDWGRSFSGSQADAIKTLSTDDKSMCLLAAIARRQRRTSEAIEKLAKETGKLARAMTRLLELVEVRNREMIQND